MGVEDGLKYMALEDEDGGDSILEVWVFWGGLGFRVRTVGLRFWKFGCFGV